MALTDNTKRVKKEITAQVGDQFLCNGSLFTLFTCFYNTRSKRIKEKIIPHYTVHSISLRFTVHLLLHGYAL